MPEDTQKLLTLGLAFVGAALGIFNTWRQWRRDQVNIVVTWKPEPWGGRLGTAVTVHSVKVENRSNFAVTIDDVGLVFKKKDAPRISFSQKVVAGEDTVTKPLPIRVEPRDTITLTSDGTEPDSSLMTFGLQHLYVRTACGFIQKVANPLV